jgi:hypothetical protein
METATATVDPRPRRRRVDQNGHGNRGWKAVYPRQVGNGLLDLVALRHEEERLQVIEEQGATLSVRRAAKLARNSLEDYLDARINLMQREAESHEKAIRGHETEMCRRYEAQNPSVNDLKVMCGGACTDCRPGAA